MTGQGTRPHVPHRHPAYSSPPNNFLSSSSSASSSSLLSASPACLSTVSSFNFCSLLQTTPAQLPSAQNRPNVPTAFPVAFETACQQLGPLPLSAHPSSANPTRSL